MKKFCSALMSFVLVLTLVPVALAGDCTKRSKVEWQATISSGVYVRDNCPTGKIVGTAPKGEVVEILEVDEHGDFYLIRSSVGTGFVYNSYLKDIVKSPKISREEAKDQANKEYESQKVETKYYENSIFKDLDPNHKYYQHISDVKSKGIVSGNPDGTVQADMPIVRAALAKILVEATTDAEKIAKANLGKEVYSDVKLGEWYVPYLAIAKEKSIMTGDGGLKKGSTTVRPGDKAKGAEVAKMIAVAFELELREAKSWEQWYAPYMEALDGLGALPFSSPDHVVTRGEMMFMVSTVLKNL